MDLREIEETTKAASPLPYSVHVERVGGFENMPVQIDSSRRPVISMDGLLYGLSEHTVDQIRYDAQFFLNSKWYVSVLLKALKTACGTNLEKLDMLIKYADKELRQELGMAPMEQILKKQK